MFSDRRSDAALASVLTKAGADLRLNEHLP
jgi:hypothetical protein